MMGKTHIAGALASWALVYPLLAKTSLYTLTSQNAIVLAVSLGGSVLGGLIPDIDHPGSTIDRDLFGPLGKSHIGEFLGGVLLLGISLSMRIPSFMGRVYLSRIFQGTLTNYVPEISFVLGVIGAVLIVIASMKHRGITHTLLGMGLFLWGIDTLLGYIPILAHWRMTLLLVCGAGYLSHLLLDLVAHGVPLFYPVIKKRISLPFSIRTGSFWDIVVIRFGLLAYFVFAIATLYLPSVMITRLHL